jgi:5-methylcytosine-specific restriction endonuclease McrA
MPIVYENEGHRRRLLKTAHQSHWKFEEWRKDKTCRLCKTEMTIWTKTNASWKTHATLDHVKARCLGGLDEPSNWMLICGRCNHKKSKVESQEIERIRAEARQRSAAEETPPISEAWW